MQISKEDATIIEAALREAMNATLDYKAGLSYRRLLTRLQQQGMAETAGANPGEASAYQDGFRYDADDSRAMP